MKLLIWDQSSKRNPYWNLAIEEAICICLAEKNHQEVCGVIRFWQNPLTAVMGLSEKTDEVLHEEKIINFKEDFPQLIQTKYPIQDKFYIARRASGGGTVLHNLTQNLNFSFFLSLKKYSELFPIKKSYQVISQFLIESFKKQGFDTTYLGQSDISILSDNPKKISGNSQFRKKNCLVHHGTLILSENLILSISNFQKHPPKEPDYRKKRCHEDFLTFLPKNFSSDRFKSDLTKEFYNYLGSNVAQKINLTFLKKVMNRAKYFFEERYSDINYILGERK